MTRRNTPIHVIVSHVITSPDGSPRAAPPLRRGLSHPAPEPSDLPAPGVLLEPEAIVDAARGQAEQNGLPIDAMLHASPEALDELDLLTSFEDERTMPRSRAHAERLEMAIDGALATLDE